MKKRKIWAVMTALMLTASVILGGCGGQTGSIEKTEEEASAPGEKAPEETAVPEETQEASSEAEAESEAASEETAAPEEEAPAEEPAEEEQSEEAAVQPDDTALTILNGTGYLFGQDEETYDMLYEIVYPGLRLSTDDAQAYPQLAEALERKNAELRREAEEKEGWYSESAAEFKEQNPDYFSAFTDESTASVVRADPEILSVVSVYSSYSGGAHGNYGFFSYNFDPATGRELKIRDVTKDLPGLMEKVKETLQAEYPDLSMIDSFDMASEGYADSMVFSVGYEELSVYFSPYELGSWAEGAQIATIPFLGNESLIEERFLNKPETYGFETVNGAVRTDLDGDGTPETVETYASTSEEDGYFSEFVIKINGNPYTDDSRDIEGLDLENPIIIKKNGNTYLYAEFQYVDDYTAMVLYDLTGGSVNKLGMTDLHTGRVWDEEAGLNFREILTDPMLFAMGTRTDILGTGSLTSWFFVNDEGMPENLNEGFDLEHYGDSDLTLKQDLTVIAIEPNEAHEKGEEVVLPAGSKIEAYYTDNETYVDIRDEAGNCYYLRGEFTEWPLTINGVEMYELVDGMQFAG